MADLNMSRKVVAAGKPLARFVSSGAVKNVKSDYIVNLYNREALVEPVFVEAAKNMSDTELPVQAKLGFALIQAVQAFQRNGHLMADIDPLRLPSSVNHLPRGRLNDTIYPLVSTMGDVLSAVGLNEADLDVEFENNLHLKVAGLLGKSGNIKGKTLRTIIRELNSIYSGKMSIEMSHINDPEKSRFLVDALEGPSRKKYEPTNAEKPDLLRRVTEAQCFEQFLQAKAPTTKRFGIDGLESGISFLQTLTARSEADHCLLAMAHRGRLNVLANVFKKPYKALMREFKGIAGFGGVEYGNNGDVKYHLGVEHVKTNTLNGKKQRFSLLCNPSHLEAANPTLLGRSRAVIDRLVNYGGVDLQTARRKVLPIVVHGDQAMAGQGVVYESFQMMDLEGYSVGGTVHLVLNNQIGFTTTNADGMSSNYCTDIAKAFGVPVIHANADCLESVEFAARLAADYRNKFNSDIVVDICGYRRNGHNEQDMPMFTQPAMYKVVNQRKPVADLVAEQYIEDGIVTIAQVEKYKSDFLNTLESEYKSAEEGMVEAHSYSPLWDNMATPSDYRAAPKSGLSASELKNQLTAIAKLPENCSPHANIKKIFDARVAAAKTGKGIDFGTAESMAFSSLLKEGFDVRLAGQDARRGTFSHRHATIHDQVDFSMLTPLERIRPENPLAFQVVNSLLSEYAALGFELGYANHHPDTLTIWEAQFGDFANGAQIVIDQMLCSQEVKWGQQSGLVMYLPHGYDGMGPEHSSARMERFLQLCDNREDVIAPQYFDEEKSKIVQTSNMQVIVPTTASNLFHALRRQLKRGFRKPLIVFQSKRLLKAKESFSNIDEFDVGTKFVPLYGDTVQDKSAVKRLIFCSGQVYFDLAKKRKQLKTTDCAIARIEQLCPLPLAEMKKELDQYPNVESVVWAQEEPMNAGAWTYMNPRLQTLLQFAKSKIQQPIYVGRDVCASTAVGCSKIHAAELQKLLDEAFDLTLMTHSPSEYFTVAGREVTRGKVVDRANYLHALRPMA